MNHISERDRHVPVTTKNLEKLFTLAYREIEAASLPDITSLYVYYRAGRVECSAYEYTKKM